MYAVPILVINSYKICKEIHKLSILIFAQIVTINKLELVEFIDASHHHGSSQGKLCIHM